MRHGVVPHALVAETASGCQELRVMCRWQSSTVSYVQHGRSITRCVPTHRYIPVMARLAEPERMVAFRVAWVDDKGQQQVRRGLELAPDHCIALLSS
jgi:hypothetical protein